MNKKGISPVIATVLLIAIVVVLALIIFLWARGFVSETIIKEGQNVKYACEDVVLEAEYDGYYLDIVNSGNVPVYQLDVKGVIDGEKETLEDDEFNYGLSIGQSASLDLSFYEEYDSLEIYPVLLGDASSSKKSSICENSINVENGGFYDE